MRMRALGTTGATLLLASLSLAGPVRLVVETRSLKPESMINPEPLSLDGVLVQRFTLADVKTLDHRLTDVDLRTWTALWTVRPPIARDSAYALHEYGCHEGNYAMFNLLKGSRVEEKRRETGSTQP